MKFILWFDLFPLSSGFHVSLLLCCLEELHMDPAQLEYVVLFHIWIQSMCSKKVVGIITKVLPPPSVLYLRSHSFTMQSRFLSFLITLFVSWIGVATAQNGKVVVETISAGSGPAVDASQKYASMVTLYIENADGSKTPSGWSTRQADGAAADSPFEFQPGVGLIQGWTEGVLQMNIGQRAWLHVPADKGYGSRPMGSPGGAFYIPANSNLLFDIEILGVADGTEL